MTAKANQNQKSVNTFFLQLDQYQNNQTIFSTMIHVIKKIKLIEYTEKEQNMQQKKQQHESRRQPLNLPHRFQPWQTVPAAGYQEKSKPSNPRRNKFVLPVECILCKRRKYKRERHGVYKGRPSSRSTYFNEY